MARALDLERDVQHLVTKATSTAEDIDRWVIIAARAADEKKAIDPVVLRVADILSITESFLVVSGANARQVKTLADEIEARVKAAGGPSPRRIEGLADARWVLMDYGDFVVHVFLDETREFYDLERLWSDAPRIEWSEAPQAATGQ